MDEARIGTLIENIYASAFEDDGWDSVLQTMRTEFHASHASFAVFDGQETYPPFAISTLDSVSLEPYSAYYHKIDPGIPDNNMMHVPRNRRVFQTIEIMGPAAWFNCEFHNDYLRNYDMSRALVSYVLEVGEPIAYFLVHRPVSGKEYSSEEENLLRSLSPHLQHGLRIYREMAGLRAKANLFDGAFDAMEATFLLDHYGRVLRLNKAAECMLAGGCPLTVREGRLTARHTPDEARLAAALAPLQPGVAPPELILQGPAYCPGLRLGVTPVGGLNMPEFFDVTYTARVAFMVTATALGPSLQNLMALYGLTQAEAEVTLLLREGLRAPQIAARRETSIGTVNTQLKQIYAKTGVAGQVELLVKLLRR